MIATPETALAIAAVFGAAVALLLGVLLVRRLLALLLTGRMERRVKRVEAVLRRHQQEQLGSIDRLLFQLGELHDLPAVESALTEAIGQPLTEVSRPRFRKIFESLGLIDRYLRNLREAPRWSERTAAAHVLGQLEVAQAIPALVAAMRDPHEDAGTVKLAAAKALGQMEAAQAVPYLVDELATLDDWASPRIAEVLVGFGQAAVPALLQVLAGEEGVNARMWAAQILGHIGAAAAEPALVGLLRDRFEQVRISAAEALGRLKSRQAVNELVQVAMKDPVAPVRAEAARALGRIGDESALQSLVLLLSDPDYWSRLRAVEAIELLAPADPSPLEATLRDVSQDIRRRGAVALERIGVLARSIEELASPRRGVWTPAHRRLVEMGRAGLLESLLAFLEHKDLRVRARIADVLGEVGDARAVASLQPLLSDPAWPVRTRAVEAVARLAPGEALSLILPALSDPEEMVRASAVKAAKSLGPSAEDPAVAAIIGLFDNVNAEIRAGAVEAVSHIASPRVEALLERAVTDPNPDVRLCAVKAIGQRGEARWLGLLIEQLGDARIEVRIAAAEGLGRIGSRAALEALVHCMATPERELREAVSGVLAGRGVRAVLELTSMAATRETTLALVWTLGKTRDPAALPEFERLARSADADVRAAVAGALGKIAERGAVRLLCELLADRSERVRAAAVNALGSVGSEDVVPALERVLQDPDAFVRNRVAITFGRIGGPKSLAALDHARTRFAGDVTASAYVVIGYALCGSEEGFGRAIAALADAQVQQEVARLVEQEPAELRRRFREYLHLDGEDGPVPLEAAALLQTYATTIRTNRDAQVRCAAIEAIRSLGAEGCRELLLDAVATDPSPEVRRQALAVLAPAVREVSAAFEQALKDPSPEVQVAAVAGLGRTGSPQHNRALLYCFTAQNPALDQAVVQALASNNREAVMPFVDELMGHGQESVLLGGALVLGEIADPRSCGLLKAWLGARSVRLRAASARALGKIGTIEAKDALFRCLQDTGEEVRLVATEALSCMPGNDVLQALSALCQDPSRTIRLTLARIVAGLRQVGAVELAETLARDPDEQVRQEALLSLIGLRDTEALQRFLTHLAEQPPAIRQALRELPADHPVLGLLRELVLGDIRPAARAAALRVLPALGQRPLEVLLQAFRDPAAEVRVAAVEAAAPLREQPAVQEALERLLRDADKRVGDAVRRIRLSVIGAG